MELHYLVLAISLPLVAAILTFVPRSSSKGNASFPTGPPRVPVLGNLHQIPLTKAFVTFAEWSKKYCASSDGLLGLSLGPTARMLILSKWQHVRDLLEAKGAVYSDRPYVPACEFVFPPPGNLQLAFMPYGPKWRRSRRNVTSFLKDGEVEKLLPLQDAESTQMVWELLNHADATKGSYTQHMRRCFGAVVLASVYGIRGKTYEPGSLLRRFFDTQEEWAAILDPGAMPPFDIFPWLKWIPDSIAPWKAWKKRAQAVQDGQIVLYRELVETSKDRINRGRCQDCLVARLLRDQTSQDEGGYTQVEFDYLCGFMLEAGSDTTAMTFETFILAMAAYPELQKQAQDELDAIFGEEKMPSSMDSLKLPFLRALYLEVLRWRPGFPIAVPHAAMEDDTYQGFLVPKGTTVILNTWAIHHDPDEFAHPDVFDPSRYLANKYGVADAQAHGDDRARRETYSFGAGRRMCAGQRMAEHSLMMAMAKLLWAFDMMAEGPVDTDVKTAYKDALLMSPKDFGVSFRVRGEGRRRVIGQAWAKADEYLRRYE